MSVFASLKSECFATHHLCFLETFNAADYHGLRNFKVFVREEDDIPGFSSDDGLCYYKVSPIGEGATEALACPGYLQGRYVTVVRDSPEGLPLTMCEVRVCRKLQYYTCNSC